uniref:Uncharacterized protein n=1 Tax=Anopheles maculatus TaxID=74869 RepID=A0A182SGJ8_9DIPT
YASSADLEVVDDGESSLYNGDENHKVWNGSTDQIDGIGFGNDGHYDIYSGPGGLGGSTGGGAGGGGSTLGRPARIRQISAPVPVPPPPKEEPKKSKKDKKAAKGTQQQQQQQVGSQSLSGTLIRPRPMHMNPLGRPAAGPASANSAAAMAAAAAAHHGMMMYHHHPHHHPHHPMAGHPGAGPPPVPGRQFHTIGHRSMNGSAAAAAAAAMAADAPSDGPSASRKKKKDKGKTLNGSNGSIPIGVPVVPPMFAYPPQPNGSLGGGPGSLADSRPLSMSNRKLAQSAAAGLDDMSGNSGAESPGGTGIYRRKGHLNERAFSYSIRQEHRSRSHGSLASLQFNPPDMKKEREIAQMVAGLELNEDSTLRRRSEVAGSSGTFGKPRR